ncbi:MAG TPA: amino acid ABC transporter substrate-binding protein [Candidatus Eisenbacteria bacterium]|nr:amino acid ABC transporter substrate-binding protein [Candidatus Eisenbacteria bacterium]
MKACAFRGPPPSKPIPSWSLRRAAAAAALALLLFATADPAGAGTVDRVRDLGKLRIGYRTDARPFSYLDESGQIAGYSVALCQRIVDGLKADLGLDRIAIQPVRLTSEDRFDAVKDGRLDLLCGASTATLERRKSVDFSIPIFPSGIGALVRENCPDRLKAALEGREPPSQPLWRAWLGQGLEKRVLSAQSGTTAETWLAQNHEELKLNAEIVPVKTYQEGVARVVAGTTDALFGDRSILLNAAAGSQAAGDLVVLDRQYTYEPIALALARDDDDFRLVVDRTLSRLYRSGEIKAIYRVYFGDPDADTLAFFGFVALPE